MVAACATESPGLVHAPSHEPGSLIFWYNFDEDGVADHRHLHAGCDVTSGEKWAVNLWVCLLQSLLFETAMLLNTAQICRFLWFLLHSCANVANEHIGRPLQFSVARFTELPSEAG